MASFDGLPSFSSSQYSVKLKIQGAMVLSNEDYFTMLGDIYNKFKHLPDKFSNGDEYLTYLYKKYGVHIHETLINEKLESYNANI